MRIFGIESLFKTDLGNLMISLIIITEYLVQKDGRGSQGVL